MQLPRISSTSMRRCVGVCLLAWACGESAALAQSGEQASAIDGELLFEDSIDPWQFGRSVTVDGNTAVVGAPTRGEVYTGAIYIFEREAGTNAWHQVATLRAPDEGFNHQFGHSVALSGNRLAVGAVGDEHRGQFAGSAYLFERNQGGSNQWGLVTKLVANQPRQGDCFGDSIAIDGDTVVVGATQCQPPFPLGAGYIAIFERDHGGAGVWGEAARLTANDGRSRDLFGFSVSVSGDTAVTGSPQTGATYVFSRNASGPVRWQQAVELPASGGSSVSIYGNDLISGNASGFATIFARDPVTGAWTQTARLQPPSPSPVIGFGTSVAIDGDVAIVGQPDDAEKGGAGSRSGSAQVFARLPGTNNWQRAFKLTSFNGWRDDQLGESVAMDGRTVILGAPRLGGQPGQAYVCDLVTVNTTSGACRRVIPVVNSMVALTQQTAAWTAPGRFVITSSFTNTSNAAITNPFFEVISLYGVELENADGGPGRLGATLTPDTGDRVLSPGESMTVMFLLNVEVDITFWFRVNLRGEPSP